MKIKSAIKSEMCVGCGICVSINSECLVMSLDQNGFLRPKRLDNPMPDIEIPYCPGLKLELDNQDAVQYYVNWGYIREISIGYSTDEEVRYKGSSGGAISQIAIYLLEKEHVQGVIHVGASDVDPLKNVVKVSRTREQVLKNAGSRYSPASSLESFFQILDEFKNQKFALIGKPCDIAGVKQALKLQHTYKPQIPYLISFMCAGTPSFFGTYEILEKLGLKGSELAEFRYRGDGWPGLTKAKCVDGTERTMDYNEAWGRILGKYIQKRCKICPDGIGEFADIVCADAWHGDADGYPEFTEQDGRSLLLVRTSNGLYLYQEMVDAKVISVEPFEVNRLNYIQPAQRHRRQTILPRLLAYIVCLRRVPLYNGFHLILGFKSLSLRRHLVAFGGTLIRIIQKRI